jgi:NTE family protein
MFNLNVQTEVKKNIDISLGGNISSSSINQAFISGSYYFIGRTANKLYANIYFGRLYSGLQLSLKNKFPFRFPLTIESSFIFNRIDYFRSSGKLFFEDVKPPYIIKNEAYGNLEFLIPVSKNIVIANSTSIGGLDNEYYQIENYTHLDTPDKTYFSFINSSFRIEKRTLNKKQYPYRGRRMLFKVNYIVGREQHIPGSTSTDSGKSYAEHSWFNVKLFNESYHRILTNSFWLGIYFEANYSNKPFFNNSTATLLTAPSFNPTPHSKTLFLNSLRSDKYLALGLIPNIRITREVFVRGEVYAYQPVKELLLNSKPSEIYSSAIKSMKYLGAASIVIHTAVGPLSFSVNYYPKELKEFYFIFNYGFILFNKKALD